MPAPYEIRAGGDVKNKKQSMADLKLRRLNELNSRLKEDLERPRIKVSEASMSCVPPLHPPPARSIATPLEYQRLHGALSLGTGESTQRLRIPCERVHPCREQGSSPSQVDKREDPYAPQQPNGCCTVM
ncbi:MAG: hypothetical protein L6R40_001283 [Gallowayella cf. fulva]|nr:MAG: hypothetical protein L6R40_001283 [Xanthomendoza cf. fulva]